MAEIIFLLLLSLTAREQLKTDYATSPVEHLGCLIGYVKPTGEVMVDEVKDLAKGTATDVVAHGECPSGTVGRVHSHPDATKCWYYFPGTYVPTSDGMMFSRSGYAVDAIVCGTRLVWIGRDGRGQREIPL